MCLFQVLVALKFFATGSYQLDAGCNIFIGISQPSVSRCITEITDAMNSPDIFNEWIKFPGNFDEINATRLELVKNHLQPYA